MGTEIKTWQVVNGKLIPLGSALKDERQWKLCDWELWLPSYPEIIDRDMVIIGKQVMTKAGVIDLLGIDKSGSTVIVEIQKDGFPRASFAQAIDYGSCVAEWTAEKLGEVCTEYTKKPLEDVFTQAFPETDPENITLNGLQRIMLICSTIDSSLERMIKWLAGTHGVAINAILLSYAKTAHEDTLLIKTSLLSEERERAGREGRKKFEITFSDQPGAYELQELKGLLLDYLSRERMTNRHVRDILLPACLKKKVVSRDQLKKDLIDVDPTCDEAKSAYYLTLVSSQLGLKKNDFLRQILAYEYPHQQTEKDNFSLREQYRDLVSNILEELSEGEFFRYFSVK